MDSPLVSLLTMLRLLAFMVLLYLGLAWLGERYITRPDSKVKGFFRLLCRPVTGLVARALPGPASERRLLAVSLGIVAGAWVVLIILTEALRAR